MGAVFVSYRRQDSAGEARALYKDLVRNIGEENVFMDVDSIALGQDFRQILQERLGSCEMMLALIGRDWVDAKDMSGKRRLDLEGDYIRQEIAAALERKIPVTPVLLQGASMPKEEQLPSALRDLAYRNCFELRHQRWESDVQEMIERLGLIPAGGAPQAATAAPADAAQVDDSATSKRRLSPAIWLVAALAVVAVVVYLVLSFGESDRFVDNGDGTVRDTNTGLIWLQNANCARMHNKTGGQDRLNWHEATDWAGKLKDGSDCGLRDRSKEGDWRLPTKAEWETFMKPACKPAISDDAGAGCYSDQSSFDRVEPSLYWSSSDVPGGDRAWRANLDTGDMLHARKHDDYRYVWPVRSGE